MFYVFLAISLVFIASLVIKTYLKKPLCALCLAIASTWLVLLYLYETDVFDDTVLLTLLIGQSVTGIFYLSYRKLPKALRIFSLPFFLTMTALAYWLIDSQPPLSVFILLAVLWLAAWGLFTYRHDSGKGRIAKIAANFCGDL